MPLDIKVRRDNYPRGVTIYARRKYRGRKNDNKRWTYIYIPHKKYWDLVLPFGIEAAFIDWLQDLTLKELHQLKIMISIDGE